MKKIDEKMLNVNEEEETGVLVNEFVKRVQFIAADKQPDFMKKETGEVIPGKTWIVGFFTTKKIGVIDLTKDLIKKSINGLFEEKILLPLTVQIKPGELYIAKFGYKEMQNIIVGKNETNKWIQNKPSLIEVAPLGSDFDYFE